MNTPILAIMLIVSIIIGLIGLIVFLWGLKNGQFDDARKITHGALFDSVEDLNLAYAILQNQGDTMKHYTLAVIGAGPGGISAAIEAKLKGLDVVLFEKGKEHNIKMIAFDVVEELLPMAEQEVIRMSNAEGKATTTFNGAFGGYGEPRKRLQKLIKDYFVDLRKAGFGIFCIGHTKIRTIREKGDETEGYNVLTSTLSDDYESLFSDIFDCVLTGTIEKTVDSKKITGEERRLYMRGTGYISAGCRFAPDSVPEYIVYEGNFAKTFIDVLEEGLRKSKTNPVSRTDFKKEQVREVKELDERVIEPREEELELKISKGEVIDKLKVNMGKIDMKELQAIMSAHGVLTFANPESLSTEFCVEVLKLIEGEE